MNMTESELLSDVAWAEARRGATGLPPRSRRLIIATSAGTVLLLVTWILVYVSGALWPNLQGSRAWSVTTEGRAAVQTFTVTNAGWFDVTVTGISSDDPEMPVTDVTDLPRLIPAGESAEFTVRYRLVECPSDDDQWADSSGPALVMATSRWHASAVAGTGVPRMAFEELCS